MLGLMITLASRGTNRSMPPNTAIARRTIASGSPDRATTRSGVSAGVEVGVNATASQPKWAEHSWRRRR
jgi:hypothetical protein